MAGDKLITYITYILIRLQSITYIRYMKSKTAPPKVSYRRKILVYKYIT